MRKNQEMESQVEGSGKKSSECDSEDESREEIVVEEVETMSPDKREDFKLLTPRNMFQTVVNRDAQLILKKRLTDI